MVGVIILAGGESTRIGENKALLDFNGKPLISYMIEKLREINPEIIIVSSQPQDYDFLENVHLIEDKYPDKKTVLQALYSGLLESKENDNFVCACDMPYLNINLIKYLFSLKSEFDVVIPIVEYGPVILHTIYSKSCLPVIEAHLERNSKSVKKIFRDLNVKYVPTEALQSEDSKLKSFFHIKTFLDYILVQGDL
ncbi:MAG: molybdenum cofactor guanylyltransferase [Candidatus Sericytochromatia bacterium]|nr:molybdenum cofactor guanylyltransferase [Candidatus Sericytochromatia bacterium]